MDKIGLTPAQMEMYNFLLAYHSETGVYPTIREIGKGEIEGQQMIKKRTSNQSIQRILVSLEKRGWIRRQTLSRGIQVL
jgi:SOS-response transcriptional repressor LexA